MRLTKDGILKTESTLDALILACLQKNQRGVCADCKKSLDCGFQITHKRYGESITLNDLALKCGGCHAKEHGFKNPSGLLRK